MELRGLGPGIGVQSGLYEVCDCGQITFCPGPQFPHLSEGDCEKEVWRALAE